MALHTQEISRLKKQARHAGFISASHMQVNAGHAVRQVIADLYSVNIL